MSDEKTYSTVDPGWRNVEHPALSAQRNGKSISALARGMYQTYVTQGVDLRQLIIDAQVQAAAYYRAARRIYWAEPTKQPPRQPTDAELLAELEGDCTPDREACEHIARRFRELTEYLLVAERYIGGHLARDAGQPVPELDDLFLKLIKANGKYRTQPAVPPDIPEPGAPMPKAPEGYSCCRVRRTPLSLVEALPGATVQVSHLVRVVNGGTPGPTLCGLTRFDTRHPDDGGIIAKADLPGWDMNGGVSGNTTVQMRCGACWAKTNG